MQTHEPNTPGRATPADLITQSRAGRLTGRTRQSVHWLVGQGYVPTYGKRRLVSLADVQNYVPHPGGRGHKRFRYL